MAGEILKNGWSPRPHFIVVVALLALGGCQRDAAVQTTPASETAGTATADMGAAPDTAVEEPVISLPPSANMTSLEAEPATPSKISQDVAEVAPMIGPDGGRRITLEATRRLMAAGQVIFADTRPLEVYQEERIPGAVHVTSDNLQETMAKLPSDKWVVTYCT